MYVMLVGAVLALFFTVGVGRGWLGPEHVVARHWQSAIWTVLLVLLSHTVVMFYFLATGKQLRTLMEGSGHSVSRQYLADLRRFKSKVFPWVMAAQFSTIATFVVGGGVLVGMIPPAVHVGLGILALLSNGVGAGIEIVYIQRNTRLILTIEREYLHGPAGSGAPGT